MAKQTFTTGQVLTAAQMTSLQQTAMLGGDASAKVASYVLVAADAGTAISMSNGSATTITVNTGLFAAGDIVTIINLGAGVCTITAGTATVATSGSLALAQNQGGVLRFTSASAAIFFQFATPASGDIEGVTAGTGISGGGTSGTVTITNSMATEITAKGDLIVGTGNAAFDNLAVGTDGYTLVADSVETTGLKWVAPASGGGFTSLASGSLSGSAVTISSISSAYVDLYLIINAPDQTVLLDDDSGNNFDGYILESQANNAAINTITQLNTGNIYPSYNGVGASQVQIICYIYNYANTTARKLYNLLASGGNNCDSAQWASRSTAAVSQLSINAAAGSFAAGTYTLYGVK